MPTEQIRLTATDSGRTVELPAGGSLTVSLPSNPTTGYAWELVRLDEAVVRHTGNEYEPDAGSAGMTGSGGRELWAFEAAGTGSTVLQLVYRRHWQPDDPAGTFEVTLQVE